MKNLNDKTLELKAFISSNKINFTPALLLNGLQYPKRGYEKSDVLFFIEDLIEQQMEERVSLVEAEQTN